MFTTLALIILSIVCAILLTLWAMARAALTVERAGTAQLTRSLASTEADRDAQRDKAEQRHIRNAVLDTTLVEFHKTLRDRNLALDHALSDLEASRQTISSLQSEMATKEALYAERQAKFTEFQTKLDEHLGALTRKLYDEHGSKMMGEGRQQLEHALAPFKEKLVEFQNRINEVHAGDLRDRASLETSLKKELESVLRAQSQLTTDANRLTLALTGDSRSQGDWGELTLTRLLEQSGLRPNTDYKLQLVVVDEGEEENKRWRPDVVVYFPDNRVLVIDAKVSLAAHARAMGTSDPDERQALMQNHLKSIKTHVVMLANRDYPEIAAEYLKKSTPDFTLMFLPTESSFNAAMEQDPGLWLAAYQKRVVIVTPMTLLTTLRVVEQIWQADRRNKNTDEIVKEATLLVAKLGASMEEFEQVERALGGAMTLFKGAKNRLSGGRGSVASKAERMVELGVRGPNRLKDRLPKGEEDDTAQLPEA